MWSGAAGKSSRVFTPLSDRAFHLRKFSFQLHNASALSTHTILESIARLALNHSPIGDFSRDWYRIFDQPLSRIPE